jgi:hypothetical protein
MQWRSSGRAPDKVGWQVPDLLPGMNGAFFQCRHFPCWTGFSRGAADLNGSDRYSTVIGDFEHRSNLNASSPHRRM